MKKFISILFISVFLCFAAGPASAESILTDWWVRVDGNLNDAGATYTAPTVGGDITNVTGFAAGSTGDPLGIGTVEITFNPGVAGSYNIEGFFDVQINQLANDEYGDEFGFPSYNPRTDPYYGYATSGTTQSNTDIAFTLGYNFTLAANEFVVITFKLTDTNPGGIYYLWQYEPGENVYLSNEFTQGVTVPPPPQSVPEPATLLLMGSGFVGLFGLRRRIIK